MIVEPALVKVLHVICCICTVNDGSEWFSGSSAFVQDVMAIVVSLQERERERKLNKGTKNGPSVSDD